jgi:hypothetical protein
MVWYRFKRAGDGIRPGRETQKPGAFVVPTKGRAEKGDRGNYERALTCGITVLGMGRLTTRISRRKPLGNRPSSTLELGRAVFGRLHACR